MKPKQLKNIIFENERLKFISDFEKGKINELLSALDESVCEQIAIDIGTKCESRYLSLKMLVEFVKSALILNAHFLARKSEIINANLVSKFEEQKILSAYYFKKELKKLPEWAQRAILGDENE